MGIHVQSCSYYRERGGGARFEATLTQLRQPCYNVFVGGAPHVTVYLRLERFQKAKASCV